MKLHSFGKILSLVAVLVLLCALTCAMTVTANAETYDAASVEADMTINASSPEKNECGKLKLTWTAVPGADKYAVYCDDEHIANSLVTYYYISFDLEAGPAQANHSFKVVALDENESAIAHGTVEAAPKHNYNDGVVTDPNCTEGGYTTYTCTCGDVYVGDRVAPLGHNYGDWIIGSMPTCTSAGAFDHYHCDRCEKNFTSTREEFDIYIAPLGHELGEYEYDNNATCTKDGTETAKCVRYNDCSYSEYHYVSGTKLGHLFDHYEYNEDATCTEDGTETSACGRPDCDELNASDTRVVAGSALGHDIVIDKAVAPTCTATGLTEGKHCTRCDDMTIFRQTIDALGHTPVTDEAVEPSCTKTGLTEGSHCEVCEATLVPQETLAKLPHTLVIDPAVKPTCNSTGLTEGKHCEVCGAVTVKQNTVDALVHSFTEYTPDGNATCFEDGTKTAACDHGCGATDTLPDEGSTLGHDPVLEENPDAFILYTYCSRCGDKQFGKVQIPVPYRMPLLKGSVVLACILVILLSIRALTRPATTTPWYKRGRY